MATVYYQLERSKILKDGTHPIFLVVKLKENGKEKRARFYTGRSALQKHWIGIGDSKKVSSKVAGAGITNDRLQTLRNGADAIITNAANLRHNLTIGYFKIRFEKEVLGKEDKTQLEPVQVSFFEHLNHYIDSKKGIFQPATIKTYNTLKKSLIDFEKATGYTITFDSINHLFITLYTKYLIDDTGVLNNTLAKRIATLKAFLAEMKKQKVNIINTDFEDFAAKRSYDTTIMYLTEAELTKLAAYKAIPNSTEAHVLDAFLFACNTGIRYSDWQGLRIENIVRVNYEGKMVSALKFTMFKVHKEVIVPLNHTALSIIDKYKAYQQKHGVLFPVYTNQETNRTLKAIAKDAGIDDVIIESKKSGAQRIQFSNPKYEILTCHDARNTYATLYLERGGRPEILQRILGHSEIKQTMRYVKIVEKAVIGDYLKTEKANDKLKAV